MDWLGDCGGLLDALFFLVDLLVLPFTTFALREKLLSTLALYQTSAQAVSEEVRTEEKKAQKG